MNPKHKEMKSALNQFIRNARWGTCIGCPRDSDNNAYPEFCSNTNRYDHKLTIDDLRENYKNVTGD